MSSPAYDFFRHELLERKRLLETSLEVSSEPQLKHLLDEVDSALERLTVGTFGICEVCKGEIEQERLIANPLLCYCLDDLTEAGRRALQRDLDLAGEIQQTMLPRRAARFGPWLTYFHFEAVGPVSGDYCDLIPAGNSLYFMLGDAAGKGVAASMLMSQLHALFRALTQLKLRPPELLERANQVLCETPLPGRFATVICGLADEAGNIEIASAGHCPAILIRNDGDSLVDSTGLPIGMFCDAHYSSQTFRLSAGDGLLMYTDGVVEATDAQDSQYGTDRLTALARNGAFAPEETVTACVADVSAFRASATDDLTVMAIQRFAEADVQHISNVA